MNKLIKKEPSLEFIIPVLKWLKDPESVSKKEREANYTAAATDSAAVDYPSGCISATAAATYTDAATTKEWVNKYFSKISITREEVESELFKGEEVEYNKEFFADTKIRIESEEHSKYVQRLAFKAGYSWSNDSKDFRYKSADFLYFNGSLMLRGYNRGSFVKDISKEIFIPLPVEEDEPVNDLAPVNIYMRNVKGVDLDCYDILLGFNVTCPATQHAIKKQLCGGSRGYKDRRKDLSEAIDSLKRAVKLIDDNHQQEEK